MARGIGLSVVGAAVWCDVPLRTKGNLLRKVGEDQVRWVQVWGGGDTGALLCAPDSPGAYKSYLHLLSAFIRINSPRKLSQNLPVISLFDSYSILKSGLGLRKQNIGPDRPLWTLIQLSCV